MKSRFMLFEKVGGGGLVCGRSTTVSLDKRIDIFIPSEVINLGDDSEGDQRAMGVISHGQRIVVYHNSYTGIGLANYGEKTPDTELFEAFHRLPNLSTRPSQVTPVDIRA